MYCIFATYRNRLPAPNTGLDALLWLFTRMWDPIRPGNKGGGVPPPEHWGRGREGGTIYLNTCQNSLKNTFKINKTTLKVNSYEQNIWLWPSYNFFRGGLGGGDAKIFARKFTNHWFFCSPWKNPGPNPARRAAAVLFYLYLQTLNWRKAFDTIMILIKQTIWNFKQTYVHSLSFV